MRQNLKLKKISSIYGPLIYGKTEFNNLILHTFPFKIYPMIPLLGPSHLVIDSWRDSVPRFYTRGFFYIKFIKLVFLIFNQVLIIPERKLESCIEILLLPVIKQIYSWTFSFFSSENNSVSFFGEEILNTSFSVFYHFLGVNNRSEIWLRTFRAVVRVFAENVQNS